MKSKKIKFKRILPMTEKGISLSIRNFTNKGVELDWALCTAKTIQDLGVALNKFCYNHVEFVEDAPGMVLFKTKDPCGNTDYFKILLD